MAQDIAEPDRAGAPVRAPLPHPIRDFADGKIEFGDLKACLGEMAARDGATANVLLDALPEARDAGLIDGKQFHDLLAAVVGASVLDVTAAVSAGGKEQTQRFMADDYATTAVGAGSIIKDRFVLDGLIGSGGMGVVYRAQDRIRVEARDRNPYVAIKVLNEDFKRHPEAFIALQRECSKAQRLAHPNIATVYDFDRTGGMAFMTMELLEGRPLSEHLSAVLPPDGLSLTLAWPVIADLAAALDHAHRSGIVHADFKPANAFVCDSGQVKVLDFGIARAIRNPDQADTTNFDPGKFNALTPAYASPEMLEGEAPDPRDDIYGLGVVCYMMLAAEHPYQGRAGNHAKATNMTPKPIGKLSQSQNAALLRTLALEREHRTPSVQAFLEAFRAEAEEDPRLKRQSRLIAVLATGVVFLLACIAYLLLG